MADTPAVERPDGLVVSSPAIETRDWFAWNNVHGPARFHVTGEVYVANPGVDAVLVPRTPARPDATTLVLDLVPKQAPGNWLQAFVWVPARYDASPGYFRQVRIFFRDTLVAEVEAHDIA